MVLLSLPPGILLHIPLVAAPGYESRVLTRERNPMKPIAELEEGAIARIRRVLPEATPTTLPSPLLHHELIPGEKGIKVGLIDLAMLLAKTVVSAARWRAYISTP
jgi:hypothetical protein